MKKFLYSYLSVLLVLISSGCTNEIKDPEVQNKDNDIIDRIQVSLASITRGEGDETTQGNEGEGGEGSDNPGQEFNPENYIPYTLTLDKNSVIFVSQQTEDMPAFQNDDVTFTYSYIENSDASWDDDYNFAPDDEDDPLQWYKIGAGGSFHGGFALFALWFPMSDEIRQQVDPTTGTITYSVMQDQSTLDNLIKSDILGAYHSALTLFTRLRFRLFHLMTYVRIRLYVPVYDFDSKTGFYDDALISSSLDHATPDFAVEWSAYRSSDTEGPAISALQGDGSIIMYQHPLPDGVTEREPIQIKYTDFIPKDYFEQPIEGDYDNVRVYDFSVIMPMQNGETDENGDEISYSTTNFLNFILRSNSGAPLEYYFNQSMSANSTGSNLELKQGNFQYMELYVPRVGNKIIFVGGKINPWNHRATSFPLTPSEVN